MDEWGRRKEEYKVELEIAAVIPRELSSPSGYPVLFFQRCYHQRRRVLLYVTRPGLRPRLALRQRLIEIRAQQRHMFRWRQVAILLLLLLWHRTRDDRVVFAVLHIARMVIGMRMMVALGRSGKVREARHARYG
jgi:hypothetical protein